MTSESKTKMMTENESIDENMKAVEAWAVKISSRVNAEKNAWNESIERTGASNVTMNFSYMDSMVEKANAVAREARVKCDKDAGLSQTSKKVCSNK
jgi:hypothetical protein